MSGDAMISLALSYLTIGCVIAIFAIDDVHQDIIRDDGHVHTMSFIIAALYLVISWPIPIYRGWRS